MSAEFFIDTNVFVYHLDTTDLRTHQVAERILRDALATGNACNGEDAVRHGRRNIDRRGNASSKCPA